MHIDIVSFYGLKYTSEAISESFKIVLGGGGMPPDPTRRLGAKLPGIVTTFLVSVSLVASQKIFF